MLINFTFANLLLIVEIKALRLPKIFGLLTFAKIEGPKLSMPKTDPKINRGFERPKLSRNLPKIFPKLDFETPVENNHFFIITENNGIILEMHLLIRKCRHIHDHSKNLKRIHLGPWAS